MGTRSRQASFTEGFGESPQVRKKGRARQRESQAEARRVLTTAEAQAVEIDTPAQWEAQGPAYARGYRARLVGSVRYVPLARQVRDHRAELAYCDAWHAGWMDAGGRL